MSVTGWNATEATISGLTPSTMYSIEVAAVNSVGIGAYSSISSFISSNDHSEGRFVTCLIRYNYYGSILLTTWSSLYNRSFYCAKLDWIHLLY